MGSVRFAPVIIPSDAAATLMRDHTLVGGGGGDQLQPRRYGPVSVRMRAEERACPAF